MPLNKKPKPNQSFQYSRGSGGAYSHVSLDSVLYSIRVTGNIENDVRLSKQRNRLKIRFL